MCAAACAHERSVRFILGCLDGCGINRQHYLIPSVPLLFLPVCWMLVTVSISQLVPGVGLRLVSVINECAGCALKILLAAVWNGSYLASTHDVYSRHLASLALPSD